MNGSEAKNALRELAAEVLRHIDEIGEDLEVYRGGIALSDPERDEHITKLTSFSKAVTALDGLAEVQAQCGAAESRRVALQFVYNFLAMFSSVFGRHCGRSYRPEFR